MTTMMSSDGALSQLRSVDFFIVLLLKGCCCAATLIPPGILFEVVKIDEVAGLSAPGIIKGIPQDSLQGTSLLYAFNDSAAPSRHHIQYYYIFGSRSIYQDGWKASFAFKSAYHNGLISNVSVEDTLHNDWQLYNLNEDFNERINLAQKNPQKLEQMKKLFDEQATINNLYPLITWDDVVDKVNGLRRQMPASN